MFFLIALSFIASVYADDLNIFSKIKIYEQEKMNMSLDVQLQNYQSLNSWAKHFREELKAEKVTKAILKRKVKIAVIDSGVNMDHPEFKASVAKSLQLNFYNYSRKDRATATHEESIQDKTGHGSHVTGIIVGLFPAAEIISIGTVTNGIPVDEYTQAIELAIKEKVDIINISGGGAGYSDSEYAALKKAKEKGILVIASAGNNGADIMARPYYPASYDLDNVVAVGALNQSYKELLSDKKGNLITNYGKRVDFYTVGRDIKSLGKESKYYHSSGTSMAAPIVTAMAAQILAMNPEYSYNKIKDELIKKTTERKVLNPTEFAWKSIY